MTLINRSLERGRYIPLFLLSGELIIINLLFWLTINFFPELTQDTRELRELWLLVEVSFIPLVFMNLGSDHEMRAIYMDRVMRQALLEVGAYALFFMSLVSFLGITEVPLKAYLLFYGLMLVALPLFQIVSKFILKLYRRRGYNFTRVVIVGTGANALRLYDAMRKDAGFGFRVLGFFDDEPDPHFSAGKVFPISALNGFVAENQVRQVFFTLSGHSDALTSVIKTADDHVMDFYYVPQIPRTLARRFELHSIGSIPILSTTRNPLKNVVNRVVKRAFDLVVSSVFLCFYPLIYIPVAIAIKMSSPGPVYFRQQRTGYLGKSFVCLKFRTMRVNAGADRQQATEHDPRKTRIGDFLRRSSIDELPQFINVWRGDMSIVGPRPHMLKHTEDYVRLVDRYMVRHAVKPGITGWAQVNGYRGITDELWKMERRVEHDVWYIENWTLLLDIKIVIRTVINAVAGEKNAF